MNNKSWVIGYIGSMAILLGAAICVKKRHDRKIKHLDEEMNKLAKQITAELKEKNK